MSEAATASLPAQMTAPMASPLEKEMATAKSGLDDANKLAEQGTKDKDKALQGEASEIGKQREQSKQFAVDHPFPHPDVKPWTEKPPENDPVRSFGSWASAFGILAGAITKKGLASSLNASSAAMNAFHKNDLDAYNLAKEAWKDNTEISLKNAEWEAQGYQAAFQLMQTDQAAGIAQAQLVAQQADNKIALAAIKTGNLSQLWNMAVGLQNHVDSGPSRMLQMQEFSTKAEDLMARKQILAEWDKANPNATPEQKAQSRTQIMNPQYTINQAKTLAEGAGQGGFKLSPEAEHGAALNFIATGKLPATGSGKAGASQRAGILNEAYRVMAETGKSPGDAIATQDEIAGEKTALNKLIPQDAAIHSFEQTALKNGKVLLDLVDKVDSTGIPVIERWIRAGRKNVEGDPDVTAFNTQLGVFVPEVGKILTNPNLSGILSDSAREEAKGLVPENITKAQLERVIPLLEQDFARRSQAIKEEIDIRKGNIRDLTDIDKMSKADKDGGESIPEFKDEAAAQKAASDGNLTGVKQVKIGGVLHDVGE